MHPAPYVKALAYFFTKSHKKMELHAWHDMNMIGIMSLLDINIEEYPEPTSSVAIELHNKAGKHLIEVRDFYNKNVTNRTLISLNNLLILWNNYY